MSTTTLGVSSAQGQNSLNAYGVPGLIDLPSAHSLQDADLATTLAVTGETFRGTLTFQIAPRLMGSFRYTALRDFESRFSVDGVFYDRSFDLRYQLMTETDTRPGIVVGLQDFMGTGLFGAEYIVASKTIAPGLTLSGGLGWGRLGSENSIGNIGGERETDILGEGGVPNFDRWFRGDVAAFAGVSYSPSDRLTFKLEYSSDAYEEERSRTNFDGTSQFNAGVDLRVGQRGQLSFYSLYGNTVGLQYSVVSNPRRAPAPSGLEGAPLPVAVRAPHSIADLGWSPQDASYRSTLSGLMENDGIVLEGMTLTQTSATVRIDNKRYLETAQAIGRSARAMTRVLPASVETFTIIPTNGKVPVSAVTFRRSDLERLEHFDAREIYERARISDAHGVTPEVFDELYPMFRWGFGPRVNLSAFDPDSPVRADISLRFSAEYRPAPTFLLRGVVDGRLTGNLDDIDRRDASELPRVRTDFPRYAREGDIAITELTAHHFGRPGRDLYSRVTAGYLERMYAGVSAELLWKPVDSRLAFGAEVNAVKQRDFDQGFGLRDYSTVTGHLSAYYDFGKGYVGRVHAGRYLAEDWGATVALDREFQNGWRIGAYATLTDVSAEDFGEGSFDKGLRISIPTSTLTRKPSKILNTFDIRSLTRDGGARVGVSNRLYNSVRRGHDPEMARSWGRFWR